MMWHQARRSRYGWYGIDRTTFQPNKEKKKRDGEGEEKRSEKEGEREGEEKRREKKREGGRVINVMIIGWS